MFDHLLLLHSLFRWAVLLSLVTALYVAYKGYAGKRPFSKADNSIRHWTATIAHVQLIIGILVYSKSAIISFFWKNTSEAWHDVEISFFALYHLILMLTAVVCITIGSALAKRRATDVDKFKTMLIWFGAGLLIILLAIPWPFSPLAARPYLRF